MKKLASLLLALTLACSLCVPALAAGEPSDWAHAEVDGAIARGLVPEKLQNDYQSPITRGEFCRLVVQLMKKTHAEDFIEFIEENGGFTVSFTDTNDREIRAAAQLGIVNGVGGGRFDPDSTIERQAAATMLKRAAQLLGLKAGEPLVFRDAEQFASWAQDGVAYASALIDPYNLFRVMGGTGSFRTMADEEVFEFTPHGLYTREQAMCTMLRIYDNWEMKNMYPEEYEKLFGGQ